MSRENVELVRLICSAWERGDYGSAEWAHPEIEFVAADGLSPGALTGRAGMAEGWRAWLGAWDEFHQEADEYRQIDGERVLVVFRATGRGKMSGLEMHSRTAGVFHVQGGKVTRFVGYLDVERAFADLGLRE